MLDFTANEHVLYAVNQLNPTACAPLELIHGPFEPSQSWIWLVLKH